MYVTDIHVLRNWFSLLCIRPCRVFRNLGDQGTWLSTRPAVTYVHTLTLTSVSKQLAILLHNTG